MKSEKYYKRIIIPSKRIYAEEGILSLIVYWISWIPRRIKIKFLLSLGHNPLKKYPEIQKIIRGQRVLILGSGPSADALRSIPEDVKILICNASPKLLIDKKINRRVDLYYGVENVINSLHKSADIPRLLSIVKPKVFITNNPRGIERRKEYEGCYDLLIKDDTRNNYYLRKLISPFKLGTISGKSWPATSTGIRLLQYALYFGAKEIYTSGIDLGGGGYFWGEKNTTSHSGIDHEFMKIISKKYKNVYSASKKSPITNYIKYKKLTEID